MGEPSDGSLLKLWLRRCDGYGEPHCVASYCRGSAELPGGVLKSPAMRSGSLGAGRGGSSGDASPSAVEAHERAGDDAGDCEFCRAQESLEASRADARGGVRGGDDFGEDVFNDPRGRGSTVSNVVGQNQTGRASSSSGWKMGRWLGLAWGWRMGIGDWGLTGTRTEQTKSDSSAAGSRIWRVVRLPTCL